LFHLFFSFSLLPLLIWKSYSTESLVVGATGWLSSSEDGESMVSPPEGPALGEEAESEDNVRIEAC